MNKILIIDDHEIVCEGIATLVHKFIPGYEVIMLHDLKPIDTIIKDPELKLIILDINIPNANPLSLLRNLKANEKKIPVLILSALNEKTLAQSYLEAGAKGYAPKTAKPEVLVKAIRTVLDGRMYVSPPVQDLLINMSIEYGFDKKIVSSNLTSKEVEILTLMRNGKNLKEISQEIGISLSSVYQLKKSIFSKLNIKGEIELVQALDNLF